MDSNVLNTLLEYEEMVKSGKCDSFNVYIQEDGLLIKADRDIDEKQLMISSELQTTLEIFFSGLESILFSSYDYTTLKSLINAHYSIERIRNHKKYTTPTSNELPDTLG